MGRDQQMRLPPAQGSRESNPGRLAYSRAARRSNHAGAQPSCSGSLWTPRDGSRITAPGRPLLRTAGRAPRQFRPDDLVTTLRARPVCSSFVVVTRGAVPFLDHPPVDPAGLAVAVEVDVHGLDGDPVASNSAAELADRPLPFWASGRSASTPPRRAKHARRAESSPRSGTSYDRALVRHVI